jgi:hypothetical protein
VIARQGVDGVGVPEGEARTALLYMEGNVTRRKQARAMTSGGQVFRTLLDTR